MKVGTINYACNSGLGILVKEFYDNKILTDILIVEHFKYPTFKKWYPNSKTISYNNPDINIIEEYIKSIDILFLFETPFSNNTIPLAKKYNKPVVIMPMYEWSPFPLDADLFLTPSQLDYDYYRRMYPDHKIINLPVPSNSNIKWQLKSKAINFTHNAGKNRHHDRNGTLKLIESLQYIKSPINLTIRGQNIDLPQVNDNRVKLVNEDIPFNKLWNDTDVFIFTERFNGLSLPLQEAHAAGCCIIAGDRYPINTWLPNNPLVRPTGQEKLMFVDSIPFLADNYDAVDIANKIDEIHNTDITKYSLAGKLWSISNSWEVLGPRYLDLLNSLL